MTESTPDERFYDEKDALLALYNGVIESLDAMPPTSEWRAEVEQLRQRLAATNPEWAKQWEEENPHG